MLRAKLELVLTFNINLNVKYFGRFPQVLPFFRLFPNFQKKNLKIPIYRAPLLVLLYVSGAGIPVVLQISHAVRVNNKKKNRKFVQVQFGKFENIILFQK